MRTAIALSLMLVFSAAAQAETIVATVNGMVCAFCATGLEKTFKKQPAIDRVKVDLEGRLVTLTTKPDQTLDDATVTKLITAAGYAVTAIARQ